MSKEKQLNRATSLLSQALGTALNSLPNNQAVIEASHHIRTAIRKLDGAAKTQLRKQSMSNTQFETWWGNVQSGVAKQPMSAEAQARSLKQLNNMIATEQSKIDQLEKDATQLNSGGPDQLLQE